MLLALLSCGDNEPAIPYCGRELTAWLCPGSPNLVTCDGGHGLVTGCLVTHLNGDGMIHLVECVPACP